MEDPAGRLQRARPTSGVTTSPRLAQLQRLGLASWSGLGIVAIAVVISVAIGAISGIVVPLIIAIILGTLLDPLVALLERWRLPHTLATVISLLAAIAASIVTIAIVVRGFLQQLPEITLQLLRGWFAFVEWGRSLDLDPVLLEHGRRTLSSYIPHLSQGIIGMVSTWFSGAVAFAVGAFFAIFLLFFVLRDGKAFPSWFARTAHLDAGLIEEIVAESRRSLRGYFRGTALTAIITAPVFMVPLLLLRVPLAIPIFILYFFLSFIPYVGAWLTGLFAVLIAFGSGGATTALIVLLSLLVSNGTIQNVVSSWALGSSLRLHPVAVLLSTIVGGTVAGLLGMVLGPPLLAVLSRSTSIIRAHRSNAALPQAPESAP